jgi:type VI secretion system protein ImpM
MMRAACGFFGKIPARGDFVRIRLPAGFVAAWDGWLQRGLAASRELMGEDWLPAWLEAPVWRFALDPGLCGPDAVLGVWMPSVDRAGRHFPLTLAAVAVGARADLEQRGAAWLAAAEQAGLQAVTNDLPPDDLARMLEDAPALDADPDPAARETDGLSRWWTEGAPRVAARTLAGPGLPDGRGFAGMLDDRFSGAPSP